MRLAVFVILAASLSAATHTKVGEVKEVTGKWCRAGIELKKTNEIFLDDDIRYCSPQLIRSERIVITFLRKPPLDRPYECSSAGLCDNKTKLWLEGAYSDGAPLSPKVSPLLSHPNTSSVFPDLVLPKSGDGVKLPPGALAWGKSFAICYVDGAKQGDCLQNRIKTAGQTFKIGIGLYALYLDSASEGHNSPNALMLVTPGDSDLTKKWDAIPEVFRTDKSAAFVKERRSFLVNLNEMQQTKAATAASKN